MKLSTRSRYGIILLIDLAEHRSEGLVTLLSVAERRNISMRYLEQVAIILRRADFIRSVKGAAGGYILAREPENIIVGDVLRQLEGDMLVVDNPLQNARESPLEKTLRRVVFDPLNAKIAGIIDKETLSSLMGTIDPGEAYMYFI